MRKNSLRNSQNNRTNNRSYQINNNKTDRTNKMKINKSLMMGLIFLWGIILTILTSNSFRGLKDKCNSFDHVVFNNFTIFH